MSKLHPPLILFGEAIAASLIASGLADTASASGKLVYDKISNKITPSDKEKLTKEFIDSLEEYLDTEDSIEPSQIENIVEPVNQIAVDSVYQERTEIASQIAVQIASNSSPVSISADTDPQDAVNQALAVAIENWIDEIKGTDTADKFVLKSLWESEAQLNAIEEKLNTVVKNQREKNWYSRIDVSNPETASEEISKHLESGRPVTSGIFVDRPEIPNKLTQQKYLIMGRRGMGKTRTLDKLQSRLLQERPIRHVIIPNSSYMGPEDARGFSEVSFEGDVLLVWDDIQGMRSGEQHTTVRQTLIRLSDKLNEGNNSLYVVATLRSEFLDEINNLDRTKDRVWSDFETLKLEPLDEKRVSELTARAVDAHGLNIDQQEQAMLAHEIWYSDPSPLYVESVITSLDDRKKLEEQIEDLPPDVTKIWSDQYQRLIKEYPETRFILWGINLLRMGAIPPYKTTLRQLFSEVFNRNEFDFQRPINILKEKQWIWETENPGPDIDETLYDTRAAQMSAIDEDRTLVIEDYADFLLNSMPETIPEEVKHWIPQYHANTAMFFAQDLIGNTLDLAKPQLERAIELAPYSPPIRNNYATYLQMGGRPEEALEHYEVALSVSPEWADLRNTYASTLDKLGRPYKAKQEYEKAIESDQPQPQAHYNLATLLMELGDLNEAKGHYETAMSKGYHVPELYNNLGSIHTKLGDYIRGIKVLQKGIENFPDSRVLHLNLARSYIEINRPDEARDILLPLLEDEVQHDAHLHALLALAHSELGNSKLTEKHALKAENADFGENPLDEDFLKTVEIQDVRENEEWQFKPNLLRVVDYHLRQENYTKAWEKGQELINEGYNTSSVHRRLGDVAEILNLNEEAEHHHKKATSLDPENGKAFHHYGNFLKHQRRFDEAQKKFEHGIGVSDEPEIFNDYALFLFQNGESDKAKEVLEKCFSMFMEQEEGRFQGKEAHLNFAQILFHEGNIELSRKHYEKAIEIDEEYAKAKFGLGQLEGSEGNVDISYDYLQEAISLFTSQGMIDEWQKALLFTVNFLEDHERYKEGIKQCEQGIETMKSIGMDYNPLITVLQTQIAEFQKALEN